MRFLEGGGALWKREDGTTGQIGKKDGIRSDAKLERLEAQGNQPVARLQIGVSLWPPRKEGGKSILQGKLAIGDQHLLVFISKNDKKGNDAAPDLRISFAEADDQPAPQSTQGDEDVPF